MSVQYQKGHEYLLFLTDFTSCDICQERDFLRRTADPLCNSRVAFSIYFQSYTGVKVSVE